MPVNVDLDDLIERQRFWHSGVWILAWAILSMIADGFDLLSISYVAPYIIGDWGLTKASFGPVFSAAYAAMMVGGIAAGYFADTFGRKRTLVLATLLLGVSTLGSAFATTLSELIAWRVVAGLGIGAVPPVAIVMVNEFAPRRLRATIVAGVYLGTTLGNMLAGVVAAFLVPAYGWPIMFVIGGVSPLLVCIGLALALPESLRFLITRRPDSPQIRKIAARLAPSAQLDSDTRFTMASETPRSPVRLAELFCAGRWNTTLLFWLAYFCSGLTLTTLLSWWPTALTALGVSVAHAALITSLSSLAGWTGGVIITRCMDRFGLRAMIVPPLVGFPLLLIIGHLGGAPELLIMMISVFVSMAYSGGHTGLHATGGLIYPTSVRANGVALGLFVTRLAGVVAPTVSGILFTGTEGAVRVLSVTAMPLLVVSASYVGLARVRTR